MALIKSFMHEADDEALTQICDRLRRIRLDAGIGAAPLSRQLGRNEEFISTLERRKNPSPMTSSLQQWAGGLGYRIEFGVENFWMFPHSDSEMRTWYAMSRAWGADKEMRLWLVSALRWWRIRKGIDVTQVAPQLSTDVDSVRRWEFEATDPMVARMFWQARVTGTRVTMQLYAKDEWIYG